LKNPIHIKFKYQYFSEMQAAVILIILLVISFDNLIAQNEIYNLPSSDIKVNATCTYYKSKSDFITNTNASQGLLEITRQNDFIFSVKPINTKSKTKDPNRKIYIIITERDTLINLIFYSTIPEFSKVILLDSFFILFQPKDDYSPFMEPGISLAGFLYKELYKSSLNNYMPIIINQNTEKKMYLTKAQLKFNLKRLKDERIMNEFKAEKDYTLEVMLKYFKHFMQHKASIKDE
jgi:hypothetical protein